MRGDGPLDLLLLHLARGHPEGAAAARHLRRGGGWPCCSALGTPFMASALGTLAHHRPVRARAGGARRRALALELARRSAIGTLGRAPSLAPGPTSPPRAAARARAGRERVRRALGRPRGKRPLGFRLLRRGARGPGPGRALPAGFFGPSLNVSLSPPIARETPRGAEARERRRAPREVSAPRTTSADRDRVPSRDLEARDAIDRRRRRGSPPPRVDGTTTGERTDAREQRQHEARRV